MTTHVHQDCGCIINVYSDGSAGGAEIGEWCDLHGAASELLKALEALHDEAPINGNRCFYCNARAYATEGAEEHSPDCELEKASVVIAKARGEGEPVNG